MSLEWFERSLHKISIVFTEVQKAVKQIQKVYSKTENAQNWLL